MANEPSLGEIAGIAADPERGSGTPAVVIDQSRTVHELNQNARFSAENTWRKYNAFLNNKNELFKNLDAIQDLNVAPQDKDHLNKTAAEILKDILDNPNIALGGKGFDQVQAKLAKFKSEAMLSKQNKLDDDTNKLFMDRNPELYTDENKAKSEDYWKLPLGSRKPYMLDMPTIFDERTAFEGILKETTQPFSDVVGANWEPEGEGYIGSGNEANPQAALKLWDLLAEGGQDKNAHPIMKAIKKNYDNLPEDQKRVYEAKGGGGMKKYFSDRGQQYLDAYFPEGSYDKTDKGNYRFGKKLMPDANYLRQKQLDQKAASDAERLRIARERLKLDWSKYNLDAADVEDEDLEDLAGADSVLNQAVDAINDGVETEIYDRSKGKNVKLLRISDPVLLQKFATLDREGKIINSPDRMDYVEGTDQVLLHFYDRTKKANSRGGNIIDRTEPMDQRVWLKTITSTTFQGKDVGGINKLVEKALKANDNSLYKISQARKKQKTKEEPASTTPILKGNVR